MFRKACFAHLLVRLISRVPDIKSILRPFAYSPDGLSSLLIDPSSEVFQCPDAIAKRVIRSIYVLASDKDRFVVAKCPLEPISTDTACGGRGECVRRGGEGRVEVLENEWAGEFFSRLFPDAIRTPSSSWHHILDGPHVHIYPLWDCTTVKHLRFDRYLLLLLCRSHFIARHTVFDRFRSLSLDRGNGWTPVRQAHGW